MSELERSVRKSVDSKAAAPKRKHVRAIIIECHNDLSSRMYYEELARRPLDQSDVMSFKGLTVTHKVIQEGPKQGLLDSYNRLKWIDSLRDYWLHHGSHGGYVQHNVEYAAFLKDKILFHHRHAEFEGDLSLEKFLKANKLDSFETAKCIDIASHLLDLQDAVFKFQSAICAGAMNELKAGALIPHVLESYGIYTTLTHFITKLVERVESMDELQFLVERYYGQYYILRDFYINAASIRAVSSVIAVPNLPADPPQFNIKKLPKKSPKPRRRSSNATPPIARRELVPPVNEGLARAAPVAAPPPVTNMFTLPPMPVYTMPPAYQPYPTQMMQMAPPPIMVTPNTGFVNQSYMPPPVPTPVPAPQPAPAANTQWVTFGNGASSTSGGLFSNLVDMAKVPEPVVPKRPRAQTEESRSTIIAPVTPQTPAIVVNVPTPAPQTVTITPAPVAVVPEAEKTRVITKVITKTVTNTTEINKLKARIEELEKELADERATNADLVNKIKERDDIISQLNQAQEKVREAYQAAERQCQELHAANDKLNQEMQDMILDEQEQKRYEKAAAEIQSGREAVEMHLTELFNPSNLGNQDATQQLVIEDASAVSNVATRLVNLCANAMGDPEFDHKDLFAAVGAVSGALRTLFHDAKGASRLVEDPSDRQKLLEGARKIGLLSSGLLDTLRHQGGVPQDEADKQQLYDALHNLNADVAGMSEVIKFLEDKIKRTAEETEHAKKQQQELEMVGIDLDDLAERELLAAAKTIEDAAKALMLAKAQKPPKDPKDAAKVDVSDAILEAAMAITQATATLVSSAASAQRERTEKGRASAAAGAPYKRDPTWSEGLISAAKSVANSTAALVGVANDAATGQTAEGAEEALIAVSKSVAAATAQLVAAARAKSDPNSPTQNKLMAASKAVSNATSLLVAAAKSAAAQDEQEVEVDYSKMNPMAVKVKEMEAQMLILRLEKDLEKARNNLAKMRKAEYQPKP